MRPEFVTMLLERLISARILYLDPSLIRTATNVWFGALEDLREADVLTAVKTMERERDSRRDVTPADVRAAVKKLRKDRIDKGLANPPELPQGLGDDYRREQAWSAAFRSALGDGLDREAAIEAADLAILGHPRTPHIADIDLPKLSGVTK